LDEYRDGNRVLPSEAQLLLREWAHGINNEFRSIINAIARAAARWPHPEVKIALNEAMETPIQTRAGSCDFSPSVSSRAKRVGAKRTI
jgi:hypothetical protein